MTAPVVVAAVPAVAPTIQSDAEALITSDDDEFAKEFGLDALGTDGGEERIITVDEDDEETPPEGEEDPVEEPEPEVEAVAPTPAETAAAAAKAITAWKAFDAAGAEITEPDTRTFSFKANGKMHEGLTLDRVVRLAQTGFYNEKLTQEADEVRTAIPKFQEYIGKLEKFAEELVTEREKLLSDDEFLMEERTKADKANTPDARAARAEARVKELEQTGNIERYNSQLTTFNQTAVLPAIQGILSSHPTVTEEEVFGRLAILTAPLLVSGRVPERHFARLANLLEGDLGPWASQLHESRTAESARQASATKAELTKAQEATAAAKRTLGRVVKPNAKPGAAPVAKPRAILSSDDAEASIIGDLRKLGGD